MSEEILLFGALLLGHAAGDSLLQPPGLSQGKRSTRASERWRSLGAHGAVHGFFVGILLSPLLGLAELLSHAAIDRAKGRGMISNEIDQILHIDRAKGRGMISNEIDQILHIACKCIWLGLYLKGLC